MATIVVAILVFMVTFASSEWYCWSAWQRCSRTCDSGTQRRTRSCKPQTSCSGSNSEVVTCNTHKCPVNGQWTNWSIWSVCSRSCSIGEYVRFRSCNSPPPSYGGVYCSGQSSETGFCNTHSCPINGQWGTWAEWVVCNASCGDGYTTRIRDCNDPKPYYGGRYCAPPSSETIKCRANVTCPEKLHGSTNSTTIIVVTVTTVIFLSGIIVGMVICIRRKTQVPDEKESYTRNTRRRDEDIPDTNTTMKTNADKDVLVQYELLETTRQSNMYEGISTTTSSTDLNTNSKTGSIINKGSQSSTGETKTGSNVNQESQGSTGESKTGSKVNQESQGSTGESNTESDKVVNVVICTSKQSTQPTGQYSNMLI